MIVRCMECGNEVPNKNPWCGCPNHVYMVEKEKSFVVMAKDLNKISVVEVEYETAYRIVSINKEENT